MTPVDAEPHQALPLARTAGEHLESKGFENGRLDAELLMAHLLGIDRLTLYLQYDRPLEPGEVDAFRDMVRRRLRHEPVQYITGTVAFREVELRVDRRALVPRPETEVLVGVVLEWSAGRADLLAVDIGTGSGAIALSLLAEGPFARVVATDVSADALALTVENAVALGLDARLEARRGALWAALREDERFDVVVSNPPYVAESERASLPPDVRDWEPEAALFAAAEGLDLLHALVDGAPAWLRPGGLLALEVGLGQADAVAARARRAGAYREVRVVEDLTGRARVVAAELANGQTTEHHG